MQQMRSDRADSGSFGSERQLMIGAKQRFRTLLEPAINKLQLPKSEPERQTHDATGEQKNADGVFQQVAVELLQLVGPAEAKAMREKKKWTWWRLTIGADGTWHSLKKGE